MRLWKRALCSSELCYCFRNFYGIQSKKKKKGKSERDQLFPGGGPDGVHYYLRHQRQLEGNHPFIRANRKQKWADRKSVCAAGYRGRELHNARGIGLRLLGEWEEQLMTQNQEIESWRKRRKITLVTKLQINETNDWTIPSLEEHHWTIVCRISLYWWGRDLCMMSFFVRTIQKILCRM